MYKYFERAGIEISSWKSKGFSNEKISFADTYKNNKATELVYDNARIKLIFKGYLLKKDKLNTITR